MGDYKWEVLVVHEVDIISISSPLEGAHLHEGTFTLGDCCVKVTITVSHTFASQVLGISSP
jgi:hypothetical protein